MLTGSRVVAMILERVGDGIPALTFVPDLHALLRIAQAIFAQEFVVKTPAGGHGRRVPLVHAASHVIDPWPPALQVIIYGDALAPGNLPPIPGDIIHGPGFLHPRHV